MNGSATELGQLHLRKLACLLVLLVVGYVATHLAYPVSDTLKSGRQLVRLDPYGFARVISNEDLEWHIGGEKAAPIVADLEARNTQVVRLREQLETELEAVRALLRAKLQNFDHSTFSLLAPCESSCGKKTQDDCATECRLKRLEIRIEGYLQGKDALSPASLAGGNEEKITAALRTIRQLATLREEQAASISTLVTPGKFQVFWMSPGGLIAEIVFWTLLGVVVSLLFHSSQYLSENEYDPNEEWVGGAKLFYAPVTSVVFMFMIWIGMLEIAGPETRAWSLPVIAVLVGFNARKAIDVVDGASHWLLDRFRYSIQRTDAQKAAYSPAYRLLGQNATPVYLPNKIADIAAEARVLGREASAQAVVQEYKR